MPPTRSTFFGLRRILGSIGIGWRYNLQVYRLGGNDEGEEIRLAEQGFGLNYEVVF